MGLLDGGLSQIFYGAFNGIFLDATLHRSTLTGDGSGGGSQAFDDEPVKAQLDMASARMQASLNYVDTDQRIIVLAHGLDPITTDDEITVKGERWAIASVATDPATAAYELRGRLSSNAPAE